MYNNYYTNKIEGKYEKNIDIFYNKYVFYKHVAWYNWRKSSN